jgi:predicted nucleic acid-binding protein
VAEYYSGARRGEDRMVDIFLDSIPWLPVTPLVAMTAATYRYSFARRGIQLSLGDALIAATARAHGAALVTRNPRGYPMDDIRVVSPADNRPP